LIYPTRAAVIATAAGAPVALIVAAITPGRWFLALAWPLAVILLFAFDAVRAMGSARTRVELPGHAYVGEIRDATVTVATGRRRNAFIALQTSPLVALEDDGRSSVPLENGLGAILLPLEMLRRGVARFERMWVRWTGPLGLAWKQDTVALDGAFPILPDIRPVHEHGAAIFQRHAFEGLITQLTRGEGSDFDALTEFRPGMDRRSIDWKQSVGAAHEAARQAVPDRAQQPDRVRHR